MNLLCVCDLLIICVCFLSSAQKLNEKYPGAPPEAIDLLTQLLHFNPSKRLTVQQALAHPYLAIVRDQAEETVHEGVLRMDIETTPLLCNDEIRDNVSDDRLSDSDSVLMFVCPPH